jgi:signal peptidase I
MNHFNFSLGLNLKQKQIIAIILGVFLLVTIASKIIATRYMLYLHTLTDLSVACMSERLLLVDKSMTTNLQRGDIIAFKGPVIPGLFDQPKNLFKRIIAIEGDIVDVQGDTLYINGELVDHRPLKEKLHTLNLDAYYQDFKLTLGPNQLFVMGDQREYSFDSRYWGPTTYDQVIGKIIVALL